MLNTEPIEEAVEIRDEIDEHLRIAIELLDEHFGKRLEHNAWKLDKWRKTTKDNINFILGL